MWHVSSDSGLGQNTWLGSSEWRWQIRAYNPRTSDSFSSYLSSFLTCCILRVLSSPILVWSSSGATTATTRVAVTTVSITTVFTLLLDEIACRHIQSPAVITIKWNSTKYSAILKSGHFKRISETTLRHSHTDNYRHRMIIWCLICTKEIIFNQVYKQHCIKREKTISRNAKKCYRYSASAIDIWLYRVAQIKLATVENHYLIVLNTANAATFLINVEYKMSTKCDKFVLNIMCDLICDDFHIFSFFLVINHDFVIYIDLTRVAASNTAADDVTN